MKKLKILSMHPPDAEHKGFGHSPTSILNLIFRNRIQKVVPWYHGALLAEALKKKSIRREYRYKCCVPSLPFQHRSFPMPLVFPL